MRFGFGGHVEPPERNDHPGVMGVSGSGKTTIAEALAKAEGWPLLEGDQFHPPANVAKMKAGTPLTDEDRWPWLRAIAAAIDDTRARRESRRSWRARR